MASYAELRKKYFTDKTQGAGAPAESTPAATANGNGGSAGTGYEAMRNRYLGGGKAQTSGISGGISAGESALHVRPEEEAAPASSRSQAEGARRAYEDYLASEEYRVNQQEQNRQRQKDELLLRMMTGSSDTFGPKLQEDQKARQLREEAEKWERLVQQEAAQQRQEEQARALSALTEEELQLLERYNEERRENFVTSLNQSLTEGVDYEANPLLAKYGREELDKLADYYTEQRNREKYIAAQQAGIQEANSGAMGAIVGSAKSVGANLTAGLLSPLTRIADSGGRIGEDGIAAYSAGDALYGYSAGLRGQVAENISGDEYNESGRKLKDGGFARQLAAYAYQGGMSALDSGARLVVGGSPAVAAGLAAMGSFNQTLSEATEMGASTGQALALATATAGIEALSEKLPLDNMMDIVTRGGKGALMNVAKQVLTEVGEEEISFIAGLMAEAAILRDKSGYNQQIRALMEQGMTEQEAIREATWSLVKEAGETALVSAISGGMSAGGAQIAHNLTTGKTGVQGQGQPQTGAQAAPAAQSGKESGSTLDRALKTMFSGKKAEGQQEEMTASTNAVSNPIESYPPEKQNMIRSFIRSADQSIKSFVQRVKGGDLTFERKKISDVSDRAARDIGAILGIDVSGYTHNINTNDIQHILIRHGANGKADHSMSQDDDIARVGWVLENYDSVELLTEKGEQVFSDEFKNRDGTPAPQIVFTKKIDGTYYVVEAACDNRYKKLWVQSVRLQKNNGDVTQVPAEGQSASRVRNAQSALASPSPISRIPKKDGNVNGNLGQDVNGAPVVDTSGESAGGGQDVRGTGAAEKGFSAKQRLIDEYGNIPEGEKPVRPDQLPASTNGEDRVSRTARTALEARVTPDEFVPLIENTTMKGGFSYIPITNDATVQAATESIAREGWETARANWTSQVMAGVTSPEITATGALLYNHALNAGDFENAMDILMDYQLSVRNSAQALQAARIMKTLTPADRLHMIRRSVDAMVKDMKLKKPVTINETLAQQYQQAKTDQEADAILEQIAADVASQIPATGMEMFTALRYVNMLGNLRTQVRNVSGNIGAKLVYGVKDKIGALVEEIADTVTGGKIERTKSLFTDKKTRQAAARDFDQVKDWLMGGEKYNDRGGETDQFSRMVQDKRKILPPVLEQYRRATNWAMETGDRIFSRSAYARALAGYLNARGIQTEDLSTIDPKTLDKAREYAVRQAQEQTFRDNNQVSNFVGGFLRGKDVPAWAKVVGEGIMPFRKTPANVLVRAEEFSPLGLINSTINTVRAAKGRITGAELVDSWAKTLTGSALYALGMALGDLGFLVGGPDEDEEKAAFDRLNGTQEYALMLPDGTNITIDFLSPMAMPLFMGAQMQKLMQEEGDLTWSDYEKVFTSLADPMIKMSMLQGVSDTLDNIRYAQSNMGQFLINAAVSYLTQGLTNTLMGQIERSTESERMTTYVDKDSATPVWLQRALGKASQKLPGWDYQQTEYIDARGETDTQRTDAIGWLYNLVSPGYIDQKQVDAVTEELYRLHETGVEGNVFPTSPDTKISYTDARGTRHEDYNLTMEEADTLKRVTGQTAMKIMEELFKSPGYEAMTDAQKAEAVKDVYAYAREMGRAEALEGYTVGDKWMTNISGREAQAIIIRIRLDGISTNAGKTKAILESTDLSNAEKERYLKENLTAAQQVNIDEVKTLGYDLEVYAYALEMYTGYTKGDGKKERTVAEMARELGISEETAAALYDVFK